MSLANIKAKETKGKQKVLPKLKAILANPNKTKCPILDDQELEELKTALKNAIAKSNLEPKQFANQKGISLGLESSLRKINNQTSSCVFISLSIKPNYLVSLIARNAEIKDETQPVYAQPKLENFIHEIFGIQALCMAFPKDLSNISENLQKWLVKRRKPAKINKEVLKEEKIIKKKIKKPIVKEIKKVAESENEKDKVPKQPEQSWSGDYISFGSSNKGQETNLKLDGDEAVDALSEIIDKIPVINVSKLKEPVKIEPMEVDSDVVDNENVEEDLHDFDNADDFLGDYKALTVHKIKGNPNKKPKKKRKKNKKKN